MWWSYVLWTFAVLFLVEIALILLLIFAHRNETGKQMPDDEAKAQQQFLLDWEENKKKKKSKL